MEKDIHKRLLLLPLFQGLSRTDLLEIVEHVPFHFHKESEGMSIIEAGDICQSLIFLMQGTLHTCRESDDHTYRICEWINAPAVVQPEHLLGLSTRYSRSVKAATEVQLLEIPKRDIISVMFLYPIFRINFLNLLSGKVQRLRRRLWQSNSDDLAERFVAFVADRVLHPAGHKELRIRMQRLAEELGTTRLRCSRMLNALQQEGLLRLFRQRIDIPAFEKLLQRRG